MFRNVKSEAIAERLNRLILALDPRCIDLDIVVNAARNMPCYDAWVYLTSDGLMDYATPYIDMLRSLKSGTS